MQTITHPLHKFISMVIVFLIKTIEYKQQRLLQKLLLLQQQQLC